MKEFIKIHHYGDHVAHFATLKHNAEKNLHTIINTKYILNFSCTVETLNGDINSLYPFRILYVTNGSEIFRYYIPVDESERIEKILLEDVRQNAKQE